MPAIDLPTSNPAACCVCGGRRIPVLVATERMFGMGGAFTYDQCADCGALQLANPPEDLSPYYPANYYAHGALTQRNPVSALFRQAGRAAAFGPWRSLLGPLKRFLPLHRAVLREAFDVMRVGAHTRILDVGCGNGLLLRDLASAGYRHVSGVDPFIPHDVMVGGRTLVRRAELRDIEGPFDVVMMHHALEHVDAQVETLRRIAALLPTGGFALIRIPLAGTFASREYRERWVQLDAPRHLVLHTVESVRRLAEATGFVVRHVRFDSTDFQFEGSERYRRDVPLSAPDPDPPSAVRRKEWREQARALNDAGDGDQAAFVLARQ